MAENGGGGEFFLNAEATKKIQEGIQAISSVLTSETDPPATSSTSHGRCTFNHPQYVYCMILWSCDSYKHNKKKEGCTACTSSLPLL